LTRWIRQRQATNVRTPANTNSLDPVRDLQKREMDEYERITLNTSVQPRQVAGSSPVPGASLRVFGGT
jgi:hypothetical protein